MASVKSSWVTTPITLSGTFNPGEWADAGVLPMPGGKILVKNNSAFLYLAIDLVNDQGNSPGVGDYFWLSFDVDQDAHITPRFDVNYGIYPSLPIKIARQYCLGPNVWTPILGDPTLSAAQQGFAASPYSPTPHRIWELRIALAEIGIPSLATMVLPRLRFGLRVASSTPALVTDFPPNFSASFAGLHEIYLAGGPAVLPVGGPVIGTVGLIPTTQIVEGRATTAPAYSPHVTNAAFGGRLNFTFNRPTMTNLMAMGARRYRLRHHFAGPALPAAPTPPAAFAPLRRTWANYRWNGSTYVLDFFGPDGDDCYTLPNLAADYATKDLLFQLITAGGADAPLPTGFHEFRVEFLNAAGQVLPLPGQPPIAPQILQLYIDNAQPELQIHEVRYKGQPVKPCSIIEITETPDPVQVRFRAFDPEGNLRDFALNAHYGGSGTGAINLLPAGMGAYPGGNWQGIADVTVNCPTSPKFPPVTCAYQIRLSARPRVTDGYSYIGYHETATHVTFIRKGAPAFVLPHPPLVPFGFQSGPDNLYAVGLKA